MNEFANVIVSTLCFPTDGRGAVSAIRGAASAAGTTTYTSNTATDTAAAWTLTGAVPGDYAFTPGTAGANPMWGIVQSYAPAANNNVLTVDRWRKGGQPGGGLLFVPTPLVACTVHSTSHAAGSPGVLLKRIILLQGGTAESFSITDAAGTALSNFLIMPLVGSGPGVVAEYGEGIYFPHPIGFKASAVATNKWQVVYDVSGWGPNSL